MIVPVEDRDWKVSIDDHGDYKVVPNKYSGGGACLLIRRGIMCEFHLQVFSCHSSGCLPKHIIQAVEENREKYKTSIENMVTFISSLPEKVDGSTDWQTQEYIANTFFQYLIKSIIEKAEYLAR